jgi:HSP20 family molecular chaperone IbpA
MSQLTVLRADSSGSLESLNNITNAIRKRAAQLAQGTGGTNQSGMKEGGGDSDATRNWLQAERDLFCVPGATLSENDQQFSITVAVAGWDSGNLEVIATSNSVIVRSSTGNNLSLGASGQGSILYSDIDSRALFRRFDLSSAVDTSQVTATLDNGVLSITAQKAGAGRSRSTAARA